MNRLTKKKLLFVALGLLIINLLLTVSLVNLDDTSYRHLDGKQIEPHSSELIQTVIFGQLISLPVFCFLIGLIVAIFVEKELPYSRRIMKSSLLTLTIIYGLYTIMGVIKVATFL